MPLQLLVLLFQPKRPQMWAKATCESANGGCVTSEADTLSDKAPQARKEAPSLLCETLWVMQLCRQGRIKNLGSIELMRLYIKNHMSHYI